ncbi:MAG: dioxygenase, partial [Methanomassiliicoccus sp.]|nr:dioxygenase [Methanomassiliicoccus sp.]
DVKYNPPGNPELARELADHLKGSASSISHDWGIDHAATIPLAHLFPDAEVPVVEMSLAIDQPPELHYDLGRELSRFRERGILFIGSGNLIHTFREMAGEWDARPFQWAMDYDQRQWNAIVKNDHEALVHFERDLTSARAFQTVEHYLPMLYILGMRTKGDEVRCVHEGFQHGSISHRSFMVEERA